MFLFIFLVCLWDSFFEQGIDIKIPELPSAEGRYKESLATESLFGGLLGLSSLSFCYEAQREQKISLWSIFELDLKP